MSLHNSLQKITENAVLVMADNHQTDISMYSDSLIQNVIQNRMTVLSEDQHEKYFQFLAITPEEAIQLNNSLSNSYSSFYRNPLTFAFLYQYVLPRIIADKVNSNNNEIRIWSAGCAYGQEAYSLAMITDDLIKNTNTNAWFSIFATDKLTTELESARRGIYYSEDIKNVPHGYVEAYFQKKGETYTISDHIKKHVEFSEFDLLNSTTSAPPTSIFGDFDLVMCCNVLFYYKPAIQKMMLEKFNRSLTENGFLVTGEAETGIVNSAAGFRNYMSPAAIYRKR
jgi:chemotaxis methyl-accepting protein methylase